ncbi:MAG: thioredoxin family protein [Planctomycetaceae bacterium]|nr:thioredoxin family protein [Planctomycetaceae bacterium]
MVGRLKLVLKRLKNPNKLQLGYVMSPRFCDRMVSLSLHGLAKNIGQFLLFASIGLFTNGSEAAWTQEIADAPLGGDAMVQDDWETDIDVALAAAKQDGKHLLLDFTGSDWCPPCIRLENEVLSQAAFLTEAAKHFHLVKLDFPQNQLLVPAKLMEKNQEWMKRLGVDGFPTLVLLDSQQRPFGFMGYTAGGPPVFLEQLQKRLSAKARFDQLQQQAMAAEGAERGRLLDQALEALDLTIAQTHYKELVEMILELDAAHQLGLREKYRGDLDAEQRKAILADLLMLVRLRAPEDVLGLIDAMLVEVPMTPQLEASVLQIRVDLERKSGRVTEAIRSLDRLAELYADDDDAWQRVIVRKFYLLVGQSDAAQAVSILDAALQAKPQSPRIYLARGDWQQTQKQLEQAMLSYDQGLGQAKDHPDLQWELVAAKADVMFESGQQDPAIEELERFSTNERLPADLRAKALVHKAIFLREQGKDRAALLSENKAIGMIESPKRKAELERLIKEVRGSL